MFSFKDKTHLFFLCFVSKTKVTVLRDMFTNASLPVERVSAAGRLEAPGDAAAPDEGCGGGVHRGGGGEHGGGAARRRRLAGRLQLGRAVVVGEGVRLTEQSTRPHPARLAQHN